MRCRHLSAHFEDVVQSPLDIMRFLYGICPLILTETHTNQI